MALSNNSKGALLMALAMAGFTFNDALSKAVTPLMNVGQLMFVRGALTTILVYAVARHMGALGHVRMLMQPMVLLRMLFETLAAITFLNALGAMPLANVSSILQALPLAVTLGAALFLGEAVGWRRWTAIAVGFVGVLIIIRPGPEGFTMSALYVVLSVVFAAARDLVTKRIDPSISSLAITLSTAAGITLVGAALIVPFGGWQPMSGSTWGIMALASCLIFVGYLAIVMAMRTGEISFIAPFRYTSLLWAVALGMIFFAEVPDIWMVSGTVIVIGSGLYTFYRENRRRAEAARLAAASGGGLRREPDDRRPAGATGNEALRNTRFLDRRSPPHIVTLVAIAGLSALTMNIFLPSLPSMAKDLGVSYGTIQILISGYIAVTALIQIVIGPLSDRFGRRPTVIGSLVMLLIATLVCMVATDIYTLVAARMLQTAVVTGIVLSRAIVRDMVPMEEAASMIGYVTMGMTIVPMIGPTIGGVLGDAFGWRANFAALLVLGTLVLALVAADLGETNRNRSASFSAQFKAWPGLLRSPQFWGYTAVVTFTSGAFFAFLGGAPFVGATLMEMSPSTLGLQFIFIAAGYMVGNYLSGRYARRFGTFAMMMAGTIMLLVGTVLPIVFLLAGASSALAFFGPQVIVGFGNGLTLPSANAGVVSVKPHLAGSASGLSGAIAMGGGAATSVYASAILSVETGAMPLLLVMLTCGVLAIAALLFLRYADASDSWRDDEK